MDLELTPHQEDVRARARDLARGIVAETAAKHDTEYSMPVEALGAMHEAGLLSLCVPKSFGGQGCSLVDGTDPLSFIIAIEEIGRVDMSAAHCFQVHGHTSMLLSFGGNAGQHARWYPPVQEQGELLSWTGSEPGRTARGQYNLVSEAQPKNSGYVLNGIKNFGTNASIAGWNVVGVSVAGMEPPTGFLLVLVPKGAKGFNVDESWWRPSGMRAAVSPKLVLEDLYVPDEDVLQGPGFYPQSKLGSRWHLGFGANHLGAAQGLFDFVVEYLPQRGTVGNPHTQRVVGEMKMRIAAARGLIYQAAKLWEAKKHAAAEECSLMAKLYAISTAEWMVQETIRVVGSTALLETFPLHRMIRDIHVHSTHANLYNTAQLIGRASLGIEFDSTQQQ